MPISNATINITNLRLRTFIGFNPEEREKLQDVIKMDNIKNGLLIGRGFCIVRLKYLCKSMNKSVERKIWSAVSEQIENIEKKFPPKHKRLIELEIK